MPRFAILQHDHPVLHWDFLLQNGDGLLTWRLSAPPAPDADVEAEKMFDHRPIYLDYEGMVSGGRGSVMRWDGGTFEWQEQEVHRVTVRLEGLRLRGVFRLERSEGVTWRGRFTAEAEAVN